MVETVIVKTTTDPTTPNEEDSVFQDYVNKKKHNTNIFGKWFKITHQH